LFNQKIFPLLLQIKQVTVVLEIMHNIPATLKSVTDKAIMKISDFLQQYSSHVNYY